MLHTLFYLFLLSHHGSTKDIHPDLLSRYAVDGQARQTNNDEMIAFSAQLHLNTDLLGNSTIVFDEVEVNVGERYFGTSGQFACTDDGLYVFIWSLNKSKLDKVEGMRCISKLRSGGTDQKFGPKTSYYSTSTSSAAEMTAILQCTTRPPTAVTVMTVPWSEEVGSVSRYEALSTSFSGFKLFDNIAFTAELSEDQYLFPGSKIRFDRVLSNYGGHYDDITHTFQCPDDGVYVFSVSTYTRDPTTPWSVSRLMKDREVVLQGPITYRATDDYDSGSASVTAVLQCTQGTRVYVEAQAAHDFPYNSYGAELTSFTGFKLYNELEDLTVAFSAIMSNNQTLNHNQRIVFDQIVTNVGNAFDSDSSEFVCPDDDYYLFTWSTAATYGGSYTRLKMDFDTVKYNYLTKQSDNDASGTSGSSSMSVIHQCREGRSVYVLEVLAHEGVYLGGYNSFSGYKIPLPWF